MNHACTFRDVYYAEAKYNLPPQKVYFLSDTSSPKMRQTIAKFSRQMNEILANTPLFPMQLEVVQAATHTDNLLALFPDITPDDKATLHKKIKSLQGKDNLKQGELLTLCCHLLTPSLPYFLMTAIDMEQVPKNDFLSVFSAWVQLLQEHYTLPQLHASTLPLMVHEGMFLDSTYMMMNNGQKGIGSVEQEEYWRKFLKEQSQENIAANRELVYRCMKEIEAFQRKNGIHVFLEDTVNSLLKEMDRTTFGNSYTVIIRPDATFYLPQHNYTITPHSRLAVTLYVLHIRHPEGILRKSLADYAAELKAIYRYFSPNKPISEIEKKINNLVLIQADTHPADHYMSKLRTAFCEHLESNLAEKYMPQGPRGEARRLSEDIQFDVPLELKRLIF